MRVIELQENLEQKEHLQANIGTFMKMEYINASVVVRVYLIHFLNMIQVVAGQASLFLPIKILLMNSKIIHWE